jgi:hypothetical protein
MASEWIQIRLPRFGQLGRFILWGIGRLSFSSSLFVLDASGIVLQTGITLIKWSRGALLNLLRVYDQLPYAGTYGQNIIDTKAIDISEPDNIVTDLLKFIEGKHVLIVGDTGTGKSLIAQWLAYQVGGRVNVYDPDASPDEWQGLNVVGRCGNFQAIANSMQSDLEDLQSRVELRGREGDKAIALQEVITIAEEFPLLADEVEIASDWLLKHARRGRKPKRFIIALSQDDSVKALRIEGQGNVRKCFRMVRLGNFAVTHAKTLKISGLVDWLKTGKYRCMVDDYPCQLPDLSQFKAVTHQLHLPSSKEFVTTPELALQPMDDTLKKAVKACLEAGLSDSKVIKEVLGYQGSQYQEGKILLQTLKN